MKLDLIDHEQPRCVEMLAPTLRHCERLPVLWDFKLGRIAILVLDSNTDPPHDDELALAMRMHRTLARGLLVIR